MTTAVGLVHQRWLQNLLFKGRVPEVAPRGTD